MNEDNGERFAMQLPTEFVERMNRYKHGRQMSDEERNMKVAEMERAWKAYCIAEKKLEALYDWWDTSEVEEHYKEPIWYNAHRKLKRLQKAVDVLKKEIFYILVSADGNSEEYSPGWSMAAKDCYEDFCLKYKRDGEILRRAKARRSMS